MCCRASRRVVPVPVASVSKDELYLSFDALFQLFLLRHGSIDWPHSPCAMDVIESSGDGA